MGQPATRPVYPVIFIDAIVVKVRDGQVRNKPIYVVIGVTVTGERDILGRWAGDGGEGAKFWLQVLTELKNRGGRDVCVAVCDGPKALPDAITAVWELAVVQACIIHLIRNTFRFASRKYWDQIAHDLRPVYTAASEAEALARFEEFEEKWGKAYPAINRLWRNAWSEFVPFLDYDVEIRKIICSTNAIESLNARYRRAIRARGHFPNDQAALKCLCLVTRSLDPTGVLRRAICMLAFAVDHFRSVRHLPLPTAGAHDHNLTATSSLATTSSATVVGSAVIRGVVVATDQGLIVKHRLVKGR